MNQVHFVVYARPEPQGSARAFIVNGRASVTSANKNLKPYRQELSQTAKAALSEAGIEQPMAGKHVPVSLVLDFYYHKPPSVPKKRTHIAVKPDLDKIVRSTVDALTGIIYLDDAQVVELSVRKHYGLEEKAEISATIIEAERISVHRPVSSLQDLQATVPSLFS